MDGRRVGRVTEPGNGSRAAVATAERRERAMTQMGKSIYVETAIRAPLAVPPTSAHCGRSGVSDARGPADAPIILYDGVCGLCNRFNRFVLARDPAGRFRFAALQSALAGQILARHGRDPRDLDTLYLVLGHGRPGERLLRKSDAALWILRELGGPWRASAAAAPPAGGSARPRL